MKYFIEYIKRRDSQFYNNADRPFATIRITSVSKQHDKLTQTDLLKHSE